MDAKDIALIKALSGGSSSGGLPSGGVQPDLNQNDPTAADYVRNRTHYKESRHIVILDETELPFVGEEGNGIYAYDATALMGGLMALDEQYAASIVSGDTPLTFRCNNDIATLYLSGGIFGDEEAFFSGNAPFILRLDSKVTLYTRTKSESITLSAAGDFEKFHTLDTHYLPYNVPLIEDDGKLPSNVIPEQIKRYIFKCDANGVVTCGVNTTYDKIYDDYRNGKIVIARIDYDATNSVHLLCMEVVSGIAIFSGNTECSRHDLPLNGNVTLYAYKSGECVLKRSVLRLRSSTSGSKKVFELSVDDSGTISATEVT